jgi:hypothetical protein
MEQVWRFGVGYCISGRCFRPPSLSKDHFTLETCTLPLQDKLSQPTYFNMQVHTQAYFYSWFTKQQSQFLRLYTAQ